MPLFRDNPVRSGALVAGALSGGYLLTSFMASADALQMAQTTAAILAIAGLMFFITMHHRREGQIMTQTQEEISLIVGLGLFCMVTVIAWRSVSGGTASPTKDSFDDWTPTKAKMARVTHHDYRDYYYAPDGYSYDCKRRIETDVMKMLMSDFEVNLVNDSMQEFYVRFYGPSETPFAGGVWKIHVELPDQYPFKSPSIGFMNKIFHPNIDELSGSVCLDVINQTWSPMFDMINIFEVFLPQLLRYPNPNDPLNGEAAALLMRHPKEYEARVKEYVQRFATKEAADAAAGGDEDEDEDEEISDIGSISEDD